MLTAQEDVAAMSLHGLSLKEPNTAAHEHIADAATPLKTTVVTSATATGEALVEEPLLRPNPKRFVLFPIQFNDIWHAYKNAEAHFWSAEEIDISDDLDGFEKLPRKEQAFVLQAMSILCVGSGVSNEAVLSRFSDEIQIPEARCFFGFELMQKNIHQELFTVILDTFSASEAQRDDLLEIVMQLPSRTRWTKWINTHLIDSQEPFAVRVVALAIYHAIFQMSVRDAFSFIPGPETATLPSSEREKHPLPEVFQAIYKIHEDQHQYVDFMALIKNRTVNTPSTLAIHEMVEDAVAAEHAIIQDMFELSAGTLRLCNHDVSRTSLMQRVQHAADKCLLKLALSPCFDVQDPLPWIAVLLLRESMKNERHVQSAPSAAPTQKMDAEQKFTLDDDF
eukprot:jgi/Hompol1/1583/HPOL_004585-RA